MPVPFAEMATMLFVILVVALPVYFPVNGSFLTVVPATAVPATSANAAMTATGAAIVVRNVFTVAPFEGMQHPAARRRYPNRVFPAQGLRRRLVPGPIRSSC